VFVRRWIRVRDVTVPIDENGSCKCVACIGWGIDLGSKGEAFVVLIVNFPSGLVSKLMSKQFRNFIGEFFAYDMK
ncbi:hypothetical protein Gotur_029927, partial [Gossypium turneri]